MGRKLPYRRVRHQGSWRRAHGQQGTRPRDLALAAPPRGERARESGAVPPEARSGRVAERGAGRGEQVRRGVDPADSRLSVVV